MNINTIIGGLFFFGGLIITFVTYSHFQGSFWLQPIFSGIASIWRIAFWVVCIHLDIHK